MPMYIEFNECLGNGTVAESVTLSDVSEHNRRCEGRISRTAQGDYIGPFNQVRSTRSTMLLMIICDES